MNCKLGLAVSEWYTLVLVILSCLAPSRCTIDCGGCGGGYKLVFTEFLALKSIYGQVHRLADFGQKGGCHTMDVNQSKREFDL